MLNFKKLTLKNFMSFGNAEEVLDLTKYNMTLIQGINKDKEDEEPEADNNDELKLSEKSSNGSGKSVLNICVHYAIYGESIGNKVKKTNLVNKANKKNMEVSLEFEKDGVEYVIERGRSPEYLRFLVNGEDLAQGENKDTQEDINKVIGMSSDLFCQTCLLTASTQSFMEMNAAGQREIIEQLLGVQILSDKAEKLKEKIKEVKNIISNEEVRLQTVKSANDEIIKRNENQKSDYQNKLNEFEETRKVNIAKAETVLQQLQQIDIEKELDSHKKNQERLKIIEDNKKKEVEYDSLKVIITENENKIENIEKDIKRLSEIDIELEKKNHEENDKSIAFNNELDKQISELNTSIQEQRNKLDKVLLEKRTLEQEKTNLETENKRLDTFVQNIDNTLKKIEEDLVKIENNICPTCGNKLHNNEEKLKEVITQKESNIKQKDEYLENKKKNLDKIEEICKNISAQIELEKSINEEITKFVNKSSEVLKQKITDFKPVFYKDIKDVYEHQNKISVLNTSLENHKKIVNESTAKQNEIKVQLVPEVIKTFYPELQQAMVHNESVKNVQNKIEEIKKQVNPYIELLKGCEKVELMPYDETLKKSSEDDMAHLDFLVKLLTNKDSFVRKKIVEQNLSYLNQKIQSYLTQIGSLHQVVFNSDLSFDISKFGENFDFANLSRGEKTSVILALNFAFRDLYELINEPMNIMFVDELIDNGLDRIAAGNVISILKKYSINKNVFVVSHRKDIQSLVNNILTIVMECGFSSIQ